MTSARRIERRIEPAPSSQGDNAYFRALTIKNVRCFADSQHLSFEAPGGRLARWTLLLGDNGVGKTTLLQVLAYAATASVPQLAHPRMVIEFASFARKAEYSTINYQVAWGEHLAEPSTFLNDEATVEGTPYESWFTPYHKRRYSMVYAYGANRRRAPRNLTAETSDDPALTLFDDDATLRNPEEWLLQNELVANTPSPHQERARAQRDRVREILMRVLPGIRDLRISSRSEDTKQVHAVVEAHGPDGWVPLSAMGLGYRTMTAWVVDLASRMFERYHALPDPLQGAAVCLVDEIDLHLHPRWQRDLIARLTALFPNTQFIATAHSPLVVQAAPDANIVILKRDGDRVVIDSAPRSVRRWRVDQILTSELFDLPSARGAELDELIRERDELLAKPTLSASDEERLAQLRRELGDLPQGDTPEDIEAMDLIRRAAQVLKTQP